MVRLTVARRPVNDARVSPVIGAAGTGSGDGCVLRVAGSGEYPLMLAAVGGERREVVGLRGGRARDPASVHVVPDRGGGVPVGSRDRAGRLPGGVLGQDQLGAVARQHVRHRFAVPARGGGACAVMSTAIWSRLFLVIFSVPSRMAWQAASRMSQSRLPIMPRVRRCR